MSDSNPQHERHEEFRGTTYAFTSILVKGGDFKMEETRKTHSVADFYLGETPVTQALWEYVMGDNPAYFKGKQRPVERINWLDAAIFCNKLNEMTGRKPYYFSDKACSKPFVEKNLKLTE